MIYEPHGYQDFATQHIIETPGCGLFLGMGMGKTASTATAINILKYEMFEINKTLIVAPLRVADYTWTDELKKWDHLQHLTTSKILGTERQRKEALKVNADIYLINVENVVWLIAHLGGAMPFDCWVLDELSKFKNPQAKRFKALRQVRPKVKRVIGLTGTPATEGLIDLWSQLYLLDRGERLGKTVGEYREKYFKEGHKKGYVVYDYRLMKGYDWLIYDQINDICISMKAEDYLEVPELIDNQVTIKFTPKVQKLYDDFEREQILAMEDVEDITVLNSTGLRMKLLQFANGAVYDDDKNFHPVHDEKLTELEEILEAANGQPVIVFYKFQSDRERIMQRFKKLSPRLLKTEQDKTDWNNREIKLLVVHPSSAGHGLNLQDGGNIIVWYGVPDSLELYQQGITRIHRQGQKQIVVMYKLIVKGTIDEDIVLALSDKDDVQEALLLALKARISRVLKQQ